MLKIANKINEELTQEQKLIVLFQLFDFVRIDSIEVSQQEIDFIDTIADSFHISFEEYNEIKEFVIHDFSNIPNNERILIVDSNPNFFHPYVKHFALEAFTGQMRILFISSANMYFLRYIGHNELYLNGQIILEDRAYVFNYGSSIRNPLIKPLYYSDIRCPLQ